MKKVFQFATLVALLVVPAMAAEIAHLRNGFEIRHERHDSVGAVTRLFLDGFQAGYVEVPTDEITGYEHEDSPSIPSPAFGVYAATNEKVYSQHVANASNAYGVDADFLNSVIRQESGFNPKAVSPKGARGLMQLMPQTASKLGVSDSFDPAANIDAGTRYLRELLLRYNGDAVRALAAYNAGPERVDRYKGVPPFRETRAYVASIIRDYNRTKLAAKRWSTRGAHTANAADSHPEVRAGD